MTIIPQETVQRELSLRSGADYTDANGNTETGDRWPCQGFIHIPPGEVKLRGPLICDGGELRNNGLVIATTRGPGPFIFAPGVTFVADPTYDWTGQAMLEVCGAPIHLDGCVFKALGCPNPPAAAIAGGLVATDNGGNSYTGGAGSIQRVFIEGVFTKAAIVHNNWEMMHIQFCNILNKHPDGKGVGYYRGGTMMQYHSRISDRGHTQTNCTISKSRIQAQGGAAVYGWDNIQQIDVSDNIIQTESGLAWAHEGQPAVNISIQRNRHETERGLAFSGFQNEPAACRLAGNYTTQHGPKPPKMWLAVCHADQVEADSIRLRENASSTRLIDHRQTMPTLGSTGV